MDDEQEHEIKQPKKASKTPRPVDTGSDDPDDEQEPTAKHLKKASKISEYSDDEQEPVVKKPQKASKTSESQTMNKNPQ